MIKVWTTTETLCCQKVYYDSGLQASKPLLGPVAAAGESRLTCANARSGQQHEAIEPLKAYLFHLKCMDFLISARISCMKPYVQLIQLY